MLNVRAGLTGRWSRRALVELVRSEFTARGMVANVVAGRSKFASLLRQAVASPADIVVVGGGDGSVAAAAGLLADTGRPLGILPIGTLNHFAKDLGLPLRLSAAIETIVAGAARQVDVGEVNGHVFVNNSSVGLYPLAVLRRERFRLLGLGKWWAMLNACLRVFRRFPMLGVSVDANGERLTRRTPLLFIGNNAYQTAGWKVGSRDRLDAGQLCMYLTTAGTRRALLMLVVKALCGQLNESRDFESHAGREFSVRSPKRWLYVAMDGEVRRLQPPLLYRTRPGALTVCVPADSLTSS